MPDLYRPAWDTWGAVGEDMYFFLVQNGKDRPWYRPAVNGGEGDSGKGWKGPYLQYGRDTHNTIHDPWGHSYLISVGGFEGGTLNYEHALLVSAGPDGCLETRANSLQEFGDDIRLVIASRPTPPSQRENDR